MLKFKFGFIISLFLCVSFVSAICENGCEDEFGGCYSYGETVTVSLISKYCDVDEAGNYVLLDRKSTGACLNDFECVEDYNCLSGSCTRAVTNLLDQYYSGLFLDIPGLCFAPKLFCSNTSGLANAKNLSVKNCSFEGSGYFCYTCNEGYSYNNALDICTKGLCEDTGGQFCMNRTLANSSEEEGYYCVSPKKCYTCDDNFIWNSTLSQCVLKSCTSSPGCMNITNLTNGRLVENRLCDEGSCFTCNAGYKWDVSSSRCILSSIGSSGSSNLASVSESDLIVGAYNLIGLNEGVSFTFAGLSFSFKLFGIDSSKISFEIHPTFLNQVLTSGKSNNFDLDSDGVYDFKVRYAGVSSGNANISLQFISEPYVSNEPAKITDIIDNNPIPLNQQSSTDVEDPENKNITWALIGIGIVFVLLLILLIVYLILRKKKSKSSSQNPVNPVSQQPRPPVAPSNSHVNYPVGGYRPVPSVQQRPVVSQNPNIPVRPVQQVPPVQQQR